MNTIEKSMKQTDEVIAIAQDAQDLLAKAIEQRDELRAALEWIADIADKNHDEDHKLRANGARTLARISDHARNALAKVPK